MNIKKLFATLAGVSLFAQTVVPSAGVFGATYSQELQDAYNWAYWKGVTTMSSIDNANMYGAITRAEMAKMLSVYATEVLGLSADESKACNFTDIESVKGDLHDYIIKSCKLGIMGQGITAFRPYDTLSRAEFGTALSRVLWGNKYEGGTPYYANHLNALKAAGIMNQIANAEQTKEVRGYVMLMLMRSEASEGNEVDCDDPDILLACLDEDSDNCPAECKEDSNKEDNKDEDKGSDEKVRAGNLAVTATANNGKAILANGVSDMDTLTFKTSEEVEITRVTLERYGYSTSDDIAEVWLEDESGVKISNEASPDSKGQVKLSLKKGYRNIDGTLSATIVIKTDAVHSVQGNKTIGFKVIDVTSTAKNLDLDNYSPYTYTVVTYSGADVILTARGSSKTYNYEEGKSYEVAKFKLKAPSDSAIVVKSFTLTDKKSNKIEYDEFLKDVTVTVAGKEVKSSYNVDKDDKLVINLKDVELAAKENSEFVVSIELSSDFDKMWNEVNFEIKYASDISATDTKTDSRVLVKDTNWGWTLTWPTYKFEGGKVQISSSKLGNVEAAMDSTDVVIAEWEISTSQSIKMDGGTIKVTVNWTHIVKAMRLEIAGDEYEGTPDDKADPSVFTFNSSITVDHSGKIKLLVDTFDKGFNDNDAATFSIAGLKSFIYEDSKSDADVAGSLNISKLILTPSKATLTNTIVSDTVEFKAGETDKKTIFKGTYTAKKKDVNINKFTLAQTTTPTWKDANPLTVYLYLDGKAVADAEFKAGQTATDTFTNVLVKAGESISVELVAEVEAAEYDETDATKQHTIDSAKFTLTLIGEDENGNVAGTADKQTSKVSVVKVGTPEVEVGKAKNTVLLRGSTGAIAEFIVKPSGSSSIDLESVSFASTVACSKLKLLVDGDEQDLTPSGGKCVANGFVEPVDSKGIIVRIEYDDEPDFEATLINAKISDLQLNDTSVSNKFSKAYADATIKFSQVDNKSYTKYTIEALDKYNGSTQISDLHLYNANGDEFKTSLVDGDTLAKGDTFTIDNTNKAEKIEKMVYTVKSSAGTQTVEVKYSDYADYFLTTNADDLRVYDNGKDYGDPDANKVWKISTLIEAYAWTADLFGKYAADLQSSVTVSDTTISGILKYVASYDGWSAWAKGNFLVLKAIDDSVTQIYINDDTTGVLDSDRIVILKVNSDTDTLKVKSSTGILAIYSLDGLILTPAS